MPVTTFGSRLAQSLKMRGVDTVFGIPGVHNIELYRGLQDAGISHVLARHEQGAGFMADGYARATGKPGVAFVISGPGLTNIMTPMGQAYSDSVPMLVISSCLPVDAAVPGRLHQMRDQVGAGAAVCDWSICARDSDMAFALLDRAFSEFETKRARPKHITVPFDVLGSMAGPGPQPSVSTPDWAPVPDDIAALVSLLNRAQKPLFIFGGGAVGAHGIAAAVATNIGAAVFTTYSGRGVVGTSYPLNFGATLARPGSVDVLRQADLVIAVGTELGEVDLRRQALGHRATLVRVDIDPTVLGDEHNADLQIRADAKALLNELHEQLRPASPKWDAAEVVAARAAFRAQTESERPGAAPYIDALRRAMPDDALIYSDMTQFAYVAKEIYLTEQPGRWHHPCGFGTLGYALPAAIGGKIARPDLATIAIAGDYGFQYTMQELGVVAERALSLPVILWDNGRLKEIEDAMVTAQIAPNAVVAQNPDFEQLARAYGIGYCAPASPESFEAALRSALAAGGPVIIRISPD